MLRFGDSRKRYQYAKKHEMNISKAGGVINRDGRRWNVYRKPNNTHYRLIVNKNGTVRAEQVFKMLRQPGFQTKNEKNGEVIVSPDIVNNPETANGEITDKTGVPKFDFEEITFDLGTVESGESVTHEFKFKNAELFDSPVASKSTG